MHTGRYDGWSIRFDGSDWMVLLDER